jgi:hypothetical protein
MTEIDIFGIPPHPAAEVFPMLPDDELDELATDIGANGLLMPLLVGRVDGQSVLVDGRNRREACRRVGITPNYTLLLDGEDLIGYILSANIHRRNLSKGQRAMAVARICFETKRSVRDGAKQSGTSAGHLGYAMAVINHAPDLAASVLIGSVSLDNAYAEARLRKGRAETHESRFESLKAAAPDLAEMVVEGRLSLEEAQVAYDQRVSEERHRACSIDWHRRCRPREQLAGIAPTAREGNQSRPFYSNGEIFYAKDESTPGWRRLRSPCRCWASSMLK